MKQLSNLPKECWLPDSSGSNCYNCEKAFNAIRRKHHCRYCGFIFCSNCSASGHQLENGMLVKRICDKCLNSIAKSQTKPQVESVSYPNIPNRTFAKYAPLGDESNEDSPEEVDDMGAEVSLPEEEDAEQRAYEVFEELKSDQFAQYDNDAENYLETRINVMLNENSLSDIWAEHLISATKLVVNSICPSVHYRKDSMDINNYLRIIKTVDQKISFKYVKGIVFEKNLAIKKMNKKIVLPKILMLQGNSGFYSEEKRLVSIQQLEEQERYYSSVLIKKFNHIKPDLIIVEKGMPQSLISDLSQYNISILINVKIKILSLIARITGGEIVEHIDHTSWKTNYLGYGSEFLQETIGDKTYAFIINPDNSYLCGSLIISGPNQSELKKVSKILRGLVLEYRNILLERYVFSQSGMQNIPNIFLQMYSTKSTFKHLSICGNKPCAKPGVHNITYYKANGKALGDYVLNMIASPQTRCESGKVHKLGVHTYYYCKSSGRVKISMQKTDKKYDDLVMAKECNRCRGVVIDPVKLSKSSWEYSFNKFLDNFFTDIPVSHVTSTCLHDFFKAGKFTFGYKNLQVNIEWEDCQMLEISSIAFEFNTLFFKNITKAATQNLKINAEYVIEEIFRASKELTVQLNSVNGYEIEVDELEKELANLTDSIIAIKGFLPEILPEKFENHLEVENYRRKLFLMCCSMKIRIQNLGVNIKKLKCNEWYKEKSIQGSSKNSVDLKLIKREYEVMDKIENLIEPINEEDDLLKSEKFLQFQSGYLNLPTGRENFCIPIDENDNFSILAYTLNTQSYYDNVTCQINGPTDLVEIPESENISCTHFQYTFSNFDEDFQDSLYKDDMIKLYGSHISVTIDIYYAKQFHIIRNFSSSSDKEIILSLSGSEASSSRLGKSKAYFKFSSDRRYLTKILDEKRFHMFLDMAPNYFRHVYMSSNHNMPSCLVKIVGAYKVQIKNYKTGKYRNEWFVLSENLGYGMPAKVLVYDLKGTDNQRRKVKTGDNRTKMDVNFLEDFKGIPLAVVPEAKRILDASIWNDSLFLSKQNIIDYSLLVIISLEEGKIVAGIIDYMEQYTLEKAIESKYKKVVGTEIPTITHPTVYRQRFRIQVTQLYFMSLES